MSKHSLEDFSAFQLPTETYHKLVSEAINIAGATGSRGATAIHDYGPIPGWTEHNEQWAKVERVYQEIRSDYFLGNVRSADVINTGTVAWRVPSYGTWAAEVHDAIVLVRP